MEEFSPAAVLDDVATVEDGEGGPRSDADRYRLAFDVWSTSGGRESIATARQLLETYGEVVNARTLRYWVRRDEWDLLADRRLSAAFPMLSRRIAERATMGLDRGVGVALAGLDDPAVSFRDKLAAVRLLGEVAGFIGKPSTVSLAFSANNPGVAGNAPGSPATPAAMVAPSAPTALRSGDRDNASDILARLAGLDDGEGDTLGTPAMIAARSRVVDR